MAGSSFVGIIIETNILLIPISIFTVSLQYQERAVSPNGCSFGYTFVSEDNNTSYIDKYSFDNGCRFTPSRSSLVIQVLLLSEFMRVRPGEVRITCVISPGFC